MTKDKDEKILQRLRPKLTRVAAGIVGDAYAEDVVQITFMNEYRKLREAEDVEAYLVEAVKRDAQNFARGEEREFERIEDFVMRYGQPAVIEDVDVLDLKIDVRRALEKLPEDIRRAVWAVYAEGATWREVAEELGVSVMTLHDRVDKWLPVLREYLDRTNNRSAGTRVGEGETR